VIPVGDLDRDAVIWRYLSRERFRQLVAFRALWFSKLENFDDTKEGITPDPARLELKRQHLKMEEWFPAEELKRQVRNFVERGEEDGRELVIANCWFTNTHESERMWSEYAKDDEGVVLKSTIGALVQSLDLRQPRWWAGKVKYIDPATHEGMNAFEASQGSLRAFLKNANYSHENEFRVVAMNFVVPGRLNPDGSPLTAKQEAGFYYSADRPGLYVTANLSALILEVRTSPKASADYRTAVRRLLRDAGCSAPVMPSELSVDGWSFSAVISRG
jgi:hypothetical protein